MPAPPLLDPEFNYMGVLFYGASPARLLSCCIYPPDAAFLWSGDDGSAEEVVLLLWHEDEREDEAPTRWHLSTLFAALQQLYTRVDSGRDGFVQFIMIKHHDNPQSVVPPVNFRLWRTGLCLNSPFTLQQFDSLESMERQLLSGDEGDEDGSGGAWHRRPLPRLSEADCRAALEEWGTLVRNRVEFLLDSITDAYSCVMLKPMLDEWAFYYYHLGGYDLNVVERISALPAQPWYAEVLRCMPGWK